MKKRIAIFIILLSIFTLSGCKKNKLTDEISEYIKNVYVEMINNSELGKLRPININDVNIAYYFGKYEDSYVAIIEGDKKAIGVYDGAIGEFKFTFYPWEISVYKGNEYYSLGEAYMLKLINDEQLEDIYNQHEKYRNNFIKE